MTSHSPLKFVATLLTSSVDKKTTENEDEVRLCNYVDVYYNERITEDLEFMAATATREQAVRFGLRAGDILFTKDSETPGDIAVSARVDQDLPGVVCGYHLTIARPIESEIDSRFLYWAMNSRNVRDQFCNLATGVTRFGLRQDDVGRVSVPVPDLGRQGAIADYLDVEISRIDALIEKKQRMIELLEKRVDAEIQWWIGRSPLAGHDEVGLEMVRRLLVKHDRWTTEPGEMITAFRDGEVISRSARGREGFTNSSSDLARLQRVNVGDVVIHGLDGFSGAIGDSQYQGVCSPVYHVCSPVDGDPTFYGRLLRILATSGYLGNFAVSTRERAVDFRNWDLFGRIPIPSVPARDQRRLGAAIRSIRPLREKIAASEVVATEKRFSLITAVVTGEFKIGGVAA
jgi:type I restriction enzyme S subunit